MFQNEAIEYLFRFSVAVDALDLLFEDKVQLLYCTLLLPII